MRPKLILRFLPAVLLLISILACKSLPFFNEPTPFAFPTADLTLTEIFSILEGTPTNTPAPAFTSTSASASATGAPSATTAPTVTATQEQALVSTVTATAKPPTAVPTAPPTARPADTVSANFMSSAPVIDGMLGEWTSLKYNMDKVVYGSANWDSSTDHSGWFQIGWDWNNLYIGVYIRDAVYVQNESGDGLYKGDSVEVLLDANLLADYGLAELSADDYQLGFSPGKPSISSVPEVFVWFPHSKTGGTTDVKTDSRATDEGYVVEASIAWKLFGISPAGGQRYGFCLSGSDNDKIGDSVQQSMISNISTRYLTNPMTWGNLILNNP